jgi:uncharacterized membrane protein SirB2
MILFLRFLVFQGKKWLPKVPFFVSYCTLVQMALSRRIYKSAQICLRVFNWAIKTFSMMLQMPTSSSSRQTIY